MQIDLEALSPGWPEVDTLTQYDQWLRWNYAQASEVAESGSSISTELAMRWLHLIEVVRDYRLQKPLEDLE